MNLSFPACHVALFACIASAGCVLPRGLVSGDSASPGDSTSPREAFAENPLSGKPVEWTHKPENLPLVGDRACTTWPIEDRIMVTATENEICVRLKMHKLQGTAFGSPGDGDFSIESDGSGDGPVQTDLFKAVATKLGTCTETTQTRAVWARTFDRCIPNMNSSDKPIITKNSTYLRVDDKRWKFHAATPAPAAAKASPPR